MEKRVSPDFISDLKTNEVFVFGSNLDGAHGAGAARIARERFGAIWGQGPVYKGNLWDTYHAWGHRGDQPRGRIH